MSHASTGTIRTANNDNLVNFSTNEFVSNGEIPLNEKQKMMRDIIYVIVQCEVRTRIGCSAESRDSRRLQTSTTTARPRQQQQPHE